MKREITEQEERAYHLCHHEFHGHTVTEAAILMGVSVSQVRRLLRNVKQKAPQLFPILTKQQYLIFQLYVERGLTQRVIAEMLKTTQSNIHAIIQRMKKKGVKGLDVTGIGDTVSYDSSMDKHVKQKF
jgi:transposase